MSARRQRSRKDLACTADATAYQRQFVADLKRRVVDNGEPFAIAQADTPHEIFHAMDIPLVSNQWWSAYISAKQLSPRYFAVLDKLGYPANSCRYCSLGLACTLDNDPATAPWGGLPKPTVLVARLTCECIQHVFGQWAEALGTRILSARGARLAAQGSGVVQALERSDWEEVYEPRRIELLVKEMRELIELLEARTGRKFDEDKFVRAHARHQRTGSLHRRSRADDRRRAPLPRVDRRPDAQHDDSAVASRLALGDRARAPFPRRGRAIASPRGIGAPAATNACA